MRKRTENTLLATALVAALVGGYAVGQVIHTPQPDITVMPCSAWADDAHPTIPAYTATDACVTDDGYLSTPDAPEHVVSTPAPEVVIIDTTRYGAPIKESR
jgi:hypothetical protein